MAGVSVKNTERRVGILLLTIIISFAAYTRLTGLDIIREQVDEIGDMPVAEEIERGEYWRWWSAPKYQHGLSTFLTYGLHKYSPWQPNYRLASRQSAGIMGVASIAVVAAAGWYFGVVAAVVAALTLTLSYWHWAITQAHPLVITAMLFPAITYAFLLLAWRPRGRVSSMVYAALFGLSLGLSLRSYTPAMVLAPVVLCWGIFHLALGPNRRHMATIIIVGLAFAAIPLWNSILHPRLYASRLMTQHEQNFNTIADKYPDGPSVTEIVDFYLNTHVKYGTMKLFADRAHMWAGGSLASGPVFNIIELILAAIGIYVVLCNLRSPPHTFLLICLLGVFLGATISANPFAAYRYVVVLVPVGILAGLAVQQMFANSFYVVVVPFGLLLFCQDAYMNWNMANTLREQQKCTRPSSEAIGEAISRMERGPLYYVMLSPSDQGNWHFKALTSKHKVEKIEGIAGIQGKGGVLVYAPDMIEQAKIFGEHKKLTDSCDQTIGFMVDLGRSESPGENTSPRS